MLVCASACKDVCDSTEVCVCAREISHVVIQVTSYVYYFKDDPVHFAAS